MKLKNVILLFAVVIFIILIASFILLDYLVPKDTKFIEFDFKTNKTTLKYGVNLDPDKLHFGRMCPDCLGKRKISIKNTADYNQKAKITISYYDKGVNIEEWIYFVPPSGTIIKINETKPFEIKIYAPKDIENNLHEGIFVIQLFKTWPWEHPSEKIAEFKPLTESDTNPILNIV